MFKMKVLFGIFLCVFIACTNRVNIAGDPKQRLTEYVSRSFSVRSESDKEILLEYLTGDVKSRLAAWSKEQFREAFIEIKREFIQLVIREIRQISDHEVEITYELKYDESGGHPKGHSNRATITTKKMCQMVLVDGKWMISDVKNIKELLEFKDELSFP